MRFTKIRIDGYGRFSAKELEPGPGVQVIAGPNEEGKSTIRYFIADMLYGQKRSSSQRLYEESNELRSPWNKEDGYGGRLEYVLDSGRALEVQRSFDRDDEWARVYDRTNARDITSEFETARNRESKFAERHLGLTKEVFLGVATISHLTLEDLGDKQALARIREKLASLTGAGSEKSSADEALKRLGERIAAIGQPAARTKPLPFARARLVDLQKEYERVMAVRREVGELEGRRRAVLEELDGVLKRRAALERELEAQGTMERAGRLKKAEALTGRIDGMTKACFELASVRDFPLAQAPQAQKAATLADQAAAQVERTEAESDALRKRVDAETERLGPDAAMALEEIDPEKENRLAELEGRIHRLTDRLHELEEDRTAEESRHNQARKDLAALPDFSRLSADPVEWLTQLANSFSVARRARDDEGAKRNRLRDAAAGKKEDLEGPRGLFEAIDDFPAVAREYESMAREHEGTSARFGKEAEGLSGRAEEIGNKIPGFKITALLSLAGVVVSIGVALQTKNPGIYIPGLFATLMLLFSLVSVLVARRLAIRAESRLARIEGELDKIRHAAEESRKPIEDLMEQAQCQTLREVEALYDRYRENGIELSMLEDQLAEQEERNAQATERVDQLYKRLCETFLHVGEEVKSEDGVQGAAMRATGRYQEYRDAKRRAGENRDALERRGKEIKEVNEELGGLKEEELKLSLDVRQLLRDSHYADEHRSDSALQALRGYRIRSAQLRQKREELGLLQGKLSLLEQRLESEQAEHEDHRKTLARYLDAAGAATVEEYLAKGEQAREYQDRRKELSSLEEQLGALLGGEELKALRTAAEADGPPPAFTARPADELKRDLETANEEIDARRKQEHALHIDMAQRGGGSRTLNEVEEERAENEQRVRDLELELQAASYAASVIEEVTRERHSRIAPQLAELASAYLSEITGGAYDELLVNHNLEISVRIPQIKSLSQGPEKLLSKGTVDQIYLALRLAMAKCIGEERESIPLLLDDPFANYDDTRLARAMKLLARIGETNQVLLFTCRADVVRAAKKVKAPVIEL